MFITFKREWFNVLTSGVSKIAFASCINFVVTARCPLLFAFKRSIFSSSMLTNSFNSHDYLIQTKTRSAPCWAPCYEHNTQIYFSAKKCTISIFSSSMLTNSFNSHDYLIQMKTRSAPRWAPCYEHNTQIYFSAKKIQ